MDAQTSTIIVLVGLPARGKTFIASRLTRYLNWIGYETKIFNAGMYRRKLCKDMDVKQHDYNFFDPDNKEGVALRNQFVNAAIKDMRFWLDKGNNRIAVFDATNTTRERRSWMLEQAKSIEEEKTGNRCDVFFIESICDDPETIQRTVTEVKMHGMDYKNDSDKETATKDFENRIEMYKKVYQTLDEEHDDGLSYIKIINCGQKFMVNRVNSHVQSKIVYYLMNVTVGRGRVIYLSRHGESQYNQQGKIGGDSNLSENGMEYARKLGDYINETIIVPNKLNGTISSEHPKVWVSELKRTQQTAGSIDHCVSSWKALNEIDAGVCEGLTYDEISASFPLIEAERDNDKYNYRYPMGESYYDLVQRLEPVIMELEKRDSAIVICHQAVARCILAYFQEEPYQNLPYLKVPLHTLIKLEPKPYGCDIDKIPFDITSVDTHRAMPDGSKRRISSIDKDRITEIRKRWGGLVTDI